MYPSSFWFKGLKNRWRRTWFIPHRFSIFGTGLTTFLPFCSRFASSSSSLSIFSSSCQFPTYFRPLLPSCLQLFSFLSSSPFSLSCLRHMQQSCWALFGKEERTRACSSFWEGGRGQEHATRFRKSGKPPFLSPCIYSPQSVMGCLGPKLSLPLLLSYLGLVSIPILPYDRLVRF